MGKLGLHRANSKISNSLKVNNLRLLGEDEISLATYTNKNNRRNAWVALSANKPRQGPGFVHLFVVNGVFGPDYPHLLATTTSSQPTGPKQHSFQL